MAETGRSITRREKGPKFLRRAINHLPIPAARERTLREFNEIGGNTSLSDARIVYLEETHILYHEAVIGEFIRTHAKKGDIVLIEGVQANKRVEADSSKQKDYHFPDRVTVFGWDNIRLNLAARYRMVQLYALLDSAKEAFQANDLDKVDQTMILFKSLKSEIDDITIRQRNLSMITAVEEAKVKYPKSRIFIIAGAGHFTDDQHLQDTLEEDKYIALRPKFELSLERKMEEARRRYSSADDI